ncbi:putative transcriptional regulator [Xanthomonas phage PBR31]|uniref:Putative transcriptional regulator n=1 Tax=Xanthomonas phage PPDBI TaxID=2723911 RepID=A0A6H0X5N9_9CAUD|nr:hypothetical protein [Ralstonia pickettii]NYS09335.1 hypothetical protein [Ralstonia pickettii]QIN95323.1 putative transcriptional regulator [Xanthomonas phage PBR31]QIW89371.1 putative transcriptional regulator [Xanthomonas phage PPDBI]
MGISETTLQMVCEYMDKQTEPVTCMDVGAAIGRAAVTAREALTILVRRGLATKAKLSAVKGCGVTLIYSRTDVPYMELGRLGKEHDFTELLKAWRVQACKPWNGPTLTHECVDESQGFGEFADGTCL